MKAVGKHNRMPEDGFRGGNSSEEGESEETRISNSLMKKMTSMQHFEIEEPNLLTTEST